MTLYRVFSASSNPLSLIGCSSYCPITFHKKIMVTFQRASFHAKRENFPFFFKRGTFTTHSFQGGKILVFPFASKMFIFLVKLYNEMFVQAFYRDFFIIFNQIVFFFKKYFIALSRVYFTLGGIGGPEKDQSLRVS